MEPQVTVIGAGLAGCEVSYQLAQSGISVELFEMKPTKRSPAHVSDRFAELVCSNSLRSRNVTNAVGLLKDEMQRMGSLIIEAALASQVPAGDALAVDRDQFAGHIEQAIRQHPNIKVYHDCISQIPQQTRPTVIATGPLTDTLLAEDLQRILGETSLSFYDAIAPIVEADSIDFEKAYFKSRWEKGDGTDYVNCPMRTEEYQRFYDALREADPLAEKSFEKLHYFEGCLPLEEMAARGRDTLRYGPLKPVGLRHPETAEDFHAVLQLRKENVHGTAYNLVGCQTRLRQPDQKRIFQMIPGLEQARFLRYGAIHRNTYIQSPTVLNSSFQVVTAGAASYGPIFCAGQITGVEGYVESSACGLLVAASIVDALDGRAFDRPPEETMLGGLCRHVSGELMLDKKNYQPSNITWAMVPPLETRIKSKKERRESLAERAQERLGQWMESRSHVDLS